LAKTRSVSLEKAPASAWALRVAVSLTLVLLLAHAAYYLFLCDDAFISFRYARNLSEGYGLVFNPGHERVEGYTNFLWVLLLAVFNLVGLVPERGAHVLSLAATVGLWALVVWFSFCSCPRGRPRWPCLIAPLFLAVTRSVAVWSTSGLETRLFEVLVVAGVLRMIVENGALVAGRPRRNVATFLLAGATLTRPDGLLISACVFACAGLQLLHRRRLNIRAFGTQIGWYVLIVGAHFAFRLIYYGQWLPNTYYVKVGGRTWWDMGFVYLGMFIIEYAAYLWIPLLLAAISEHRRRKTLFTPALFAAVIIPHALYITAIGGDHFEYRPIDLYFPFLFILFADGAARLARSTATAVATGVYLLIVLVGLVALPYQTHRQFPDIYRAGFPGMAAKSKEAGEYLLPENDPVYGLPGLRSLLRAYHSLLWDATEHFVGVRQEEHRLFLASVVPEGRHLRRLVETGLLPPDTYIAIACAGAIPYYSNLRVLDRLGLTDAHVARSEFREGERAMAHDKRATYDYAGRRAWTSGRSTRRTA
jgi:arabinofuranosyltransferase